MRFHKFSTDSAMHGALQVRCFGGYLVARVTHGQWRWSVFWSINGTPWAAWWGFGPGFEDRDKGLRRCKAIEVAEKIRLGYYDE